MRGRQRELVSLHSRCKSVLLRPSSLQEPLEDVTTAEPSGWMRSARFLIPVKNRCFAIVLHRGVHPVGKIRLEMLLEMLLGNTCHHSPTIPTLLFVMTSSTRTRRPLVFVAFLAQV